MDIWLRNNLENYRNVSQWYNPGKEKVSVCSAGAVDSTHWRAGLVLVRVCILHRPSIYVPLLQGKVNEMVTSFLLDRNGCSVVILWSQIYKDHTSKMKNISTIAKTVPYRWLSLRQNLTTVPYRSSLVYVMAEKIWLKVFKILFQTLCSLTDYLPGDKTRLRKKLNTFK